MTKNKYTIKRWKTEKEWNEGNSSDSSPVDNTRNIDDLIAFETARIYNSEIVHFEIYETESGETYYHSNEE